MKTIKTKFAILIISLLTLSCSNNDDVPQIQPIATLPKVLTTSTFAGSGVNGSLNGQGVLAEFGNPYDVEADAAGNVFVVDYTNNKIRKISPTGLVSDFAGNGTQGSLNGQGVLAEFNRPRGITIDALGNLFVADWGNGKIRKITPDGVVSTFAGSGIVSQTDGIATVASFRSLNGIAINKSNGIVYVIDDGLIRKITPDGNVATFAGNSSDNFANGQGILATFLAPRGLAVDTNGNVYVADFNNNCIRKITPSGLVSTFAGTRIIGNLNGQREVAQFNKPNCITIDDLGNFYIGDKNNFQIRKIDTNGIVSVYAGNGTVGNTDGQGTAVSFNEVLGITVDTNGIIYVAERFLNKIRKIALE